MASSEFTAIPADMESKDRLADQLLNELEQLKESQAARKAHRAALREQANLRDGSMTTDLDKLQGKRQELTTLFRRVMDGDLPRGRLLKSNEPDRLDERHLQVVMLRSAGMDQGAIARVTGFTEPWISIILNHPDAQTVLARIIGYASDNILDLNARIQGTAAEAFDTVVHVMRTTADESLSSRNAFEILKMAGYGAVERKQFTHSFGLSDEGARELAAAMKEAQGLQSLEYAEFVDVHVQQQLGSGSVSSGSPATSADSGQTSVSVPPTDGSQSPSAPLET